MPRKLSLTIDDRLYMRLEKHAHINQESLQDFLTKAVCDALDMWDDFYDTQCALDKGDARPAVSFFSNR